MAALALAVHDVPLDHLDGGQLHRLAAVLAVVAPGLRLTTDPSPQEDPVHTTTPALAAERAGPDLQDDQQPSAKSGEGAPPAMPEDDGQDVELDELFAALAVERRATAQALAERDRLLADAPALTAGAQAVRAITAQRQRAEDERAIAVLRVELDHAQQRTAVTVAHLVVSVAGLALAERGLACDQRAALALTAAVPLADLVVAVDGRVDVEAATAALRAAARTATSAGGDR